MNELQDKIENRRREIEEIDKNITNHIEQEARKIAIERINNDVTISKLASTIKRNLITNKSLVATLESLPFRKGVIAASLIALSPFGLLINYEIGVISIGLALLAYNDIANSENTNIPLELSKNRTSQFDRIAPYLTSAYIYIIFIISIIEIIS